MHFQLSAHLFGCRHSRGWGGPGDASCVCKGTKVRIKEKLPDQGNLRFAGEVKVIG